jgi:nicotinamide-nucleotide amidase
MNQELQMKELAQRIGELLKEKGLSLATAESASGGLIAHLITNIPGSSDYYKGSVIAYSNEVKISLLGVTAEVLLRHGTVSPQVAVEMAQGGLRALNADICLSDTGIAGPSGGTLKKAVGLFYIGLACQKDAQYRQHSFSGEREDNKQAATKAALKWLKEYLEKPEHQNTEKERSS